jgi:hypothetical protein
VNDMPSSESLAHSGAVRAIGLCRRGAVGDGIALYQKVLKKHWRPLPVGVHLKFLRSFGLPDAADIIRGRRLRHPNQLVQATRASMSRSALHIFIRKPMCWTASNG